jgi:hypothetical protein
MHSEARYFVQLIYVNQKENIKPTKNIYCVIMHNFYYKYILGND